MLTKDDSIKQKKKCLNMTCIHKLCSRFIYCFGHLRLIDENTKAWTMSIKSQ